METYGGGVLIVNSLSRRRPDGHQGGTRGHGELVGWLWQPATLLGLVLQQVCEMV